jgi:putative SOS response-associated peptidase YedK
MCGRYASARKRQELLEEFGVRASHTGEALQPDYNVAPTKQVYAVLTRSDRDGQRSGGDRGGAGDTPPTRAPASPGPPAGTGSDADGKAVTRQLRVLRWGLVPSWATDPSLGSKMINARSETVAVKPAFRRAFARRRCLLPADGYYEWQSVPADDGRMRKQPFFFHPRDGGILAMAGIYELWRVPGKPADDPDAFLWTAAVITTQAGDELGGVHDRMPMVIERGNWASWLDPARTDPDDLRGLLVPAAAAGLDTRVVSPAVNNVRNNGPGLIEPAPPGEDSRTPPGSLF